MHKGYKRKKIYGNECLSKDYVNQEIAKTLLTL